jgi:hypothetical protein
MDESNVATAMREQRRVELRSLTIATSRLYESVSAAVARPADSSIGGWKVVRVPLAELTAANMPITIPADQAQHGVLTVRQGRIRIAYEGLDPAIEIGPENSPLILPEAIERTTIVSEHPATVFCVLLGRSSGNGSAVDSRAFDRAE